jgi:hypothetical protein
MRHPRRRESRRWPAVALWSSCDPWAAARGPGGAQPSSPRGTDTRQGDAHACGGEHIRWWFADSSAKSTTKQARNTRPGVLQQTRAVWGAGAALPRCPSPRSADLKRAPSNFSKSGRDGRRGAAAQHTHYGAVHGDAGQPRAMRASSAPPGAYSARSRAPHASVTRAWTDERAHALSSRGADSSGKANSNFPAKKILTIGAMRYNKAVHWSVNGTTCQYQRKTNGSNKDTHEPGVYTWHYSSTHSRLNLPLLVYATAGPMIYTGRTIFRRNHRRRSVSQPRRSICRHALPSCASAGAGAKDPSGLRRARGGQRVCAGMRVGHLHGIRWSGMVARSRLPHRLCKSTPFLAQFW